MCLTKNQSIVLFDGICNMCKKTLQFSSLQSEFAKKKLTEINFTVDINSIIFIKNNTAYFYSDATANILIEVGGFYKIVGKFILLFPKFIRDSVYKFIAKHRYQWFGKRNTCSVPTDEEKERFFV
jgi:predicted DCC family thiol-disulfide oxidoreductase YuxK